MRTLALLLMTVSLTSYADDAEYSNALKYVKKMSANDFALWNKERLNTRYTTNSKSLNDRGLNFEDFQKLWNTFESAKSSPESLKARCSMILGTDASVKMYWPKNWSQKQRKAFQKKNKVTYYDILNSWIVGRGRHLHALIQTTTSERSFSEYGPIARAYDHFKFKHDQLERDRGLNPFPSKEETEANDNMNLLKTFRNMLLTEEGLYMGDDSAYHQGPNVQALSRQLDEWCPEQSKSPNRTAMKVGGIDQTLNALELPDEGSQSAE